MDWRGDLFISLLKLWSLRDLSEIFTKQIDRPKWPAIAWANEDFPVPGGPYSKYILLYGTPNLVYQSLL